MNTKTFRLFSRLLILMLFSTTSVFADSLSGRVEHADVFSLSTGIDGIVEGIAAKEGERVLAGTLLLSLESASLNAHIVAQENLLKLVEGELQESTRIFEETKSLYDQGSVSNSDFDLTRLAVLRKTADISEAQAALSDAKERREMSQIVAPVAGMVVSLNVAIGQNTNRVSTIEPMIVFAGNNLEVVIRVVSNQKNVPALSEKVRLSVGDSSTSGIVRTIQVQDGITIVTISIMEQKAAFKLGAPVSVDF